MKPDQLNVLFLAGVPYPYGLAGTQHVRVYVEGLRQCGDDVRIVSYGSDSERENDGIPADGVFLDAPYRRLVYPTRFRCRAMFDAVRYLARGIEAIRLWRPSSGQRILIHYGLPDVFSLPFLWAAQWNGYAIVHWAVEDYSAYANAGGEARRLRLWMWRRGERTAVRMSQGIIVLSSWLRRKYEGMGARVGLIPITVSENAEVSRRTQPQPDLLRVVYAGSFGLKDGVEDLVRAFDLVVQKHPSARLFLAGGGKGVERVRAFVGDRQNVSFPGYIPKEDYDQFLRASGILCMTRVNTPYANAGFPYKLGEYLATGRPVVATRVSDIAVYLRDMRDAMLVDPESPQQIATAICSLLDDPTRADEMGRSGRRVYESAFSPSSNVPRLRSFLVEVTGVVAGKAGGEEAAE
jgi:glycosyltransferase involved in cell wall biosynthesis